MPERTQNIKDKLKGFFSKNNGFEKDIINPTQGYLANENQEIENTEKILMSTIKEFIDKNVKSKTEGLKEKRVNELEDLRNEILENQDLGELSQNVLDSKENSDPDQMARISKQNEEEQQRNDELKQKQQSEDELDQKVPWEGRNFNR